MLNKASCIKDFSHSLEVTNSVIPKNEVTTSVISMSEAKRNLKRLLPGIRRVEVTYKLSRSDKRKWIPAFAGMTVGGETTIGVIPRNKVTTSVISMSEAKRNLRRLLGLRLLPGMRRVEVTKSPA